MTPTAAVSASKPEASGPPPRSRRGRRRLWLCGIVVAALAIYLARAPLLIGFAGVLVTGDGVPANSVVVALDGKRSHEVAARALEAGRASAVIVYDRRPNRLVQRGLLPSVLESAQDMYAELGVDETRQHRLEGPVDGLDDLIRRLSAEQSPGEPAVVVFVCDEYQTRWLRRKVDRLLDDEAAERFVVTGAPDAGVDRDAWWRSPVGRRVVITEWCRLLASLAAPANGSPRDPLGDDELRAAGVKR